MRLENYTLKLKVKNLRIFYYWFLKPFRPDPGRREKII